MPVRRTHAWIALAIFGISLVALPVAQLPTCEAQSIQQALPLSQSESRKGLTFEQLVDSAIVQERRLADLMRYFKPIVETYIQEEKHDSDVQTSPKDDAYFLTRFDLAGNRPTNEEFEDPDRSKKEAVKKTFRIGETFAASGFAQAMFPDLNHFDRQNYDFNF